MATSLDDGGTSLSAEEHALVLEALTLAKTLCLDMEADRRLDEDAIEVRLLLLIERLEAMWLRH